MGTSAEFVQLNSTTDIPCAIFHLLQLCFGPRIFSPKGPVQLLIFLNSLGLAVTLLARHG